MNMDVTKLEYENLKVIDLTEILLRNLADYFNEKDATEIVRKIIIEVETKSDICESN